MWTLIGDPERAETALEHCLELARELGDDSWAARALDVMGLLAFFANDAKSRELFEESIVLARAAGDEWCLTDCLGTIGSMYPLQGEPEKAQAAGLEALELARRAGDQQGLRMALFGLGLAAYRRGDLAPARAYADQGLAVARGLDDSWFIPYYLWVLASVETEAGRLEHAEAAAGECLRLARELEAPMMLVCALDAAAACARRVSDDETAIALLLEAEAVFDGPVPWSYVSSALTALALVQARSGGQDDAQPILQRSLELAGHAGDPWAVGRALDGRATLALARDDHAAAEQDAAAALQLQLQLGDQIGAATSMDTIAFAAAGGGDFERAARLCAASDAVRERVGAVIPLWAASSRATLQTRITDSVGAALYDRLAADFDGMSFADTVATAGA